MRSLKTKYFYTTTSMWCSISGDDLHRIRYNGKLCFFDGYIITDGNGNIVKNFDNVARNLEKGNKFKLLSVINLRSEKNYLGRNVKTGDLLTFSEHQITFNINENEKSI